VVIARGNIAIIKSTQAIDSESGLPRLRVSQKTHIAEPPETAIYSKRTTNEIVLGSPVNNNHSLIITPFWILPEIDVRCDI
jgi:hypothetical protein